MNIPFEPVDQHDTSAADQCGGTAPSSHRSNAVQDEPLPASLTLAMIRRYYVPIAERTLFRLISAGKFPKADVRIGSKIRLWRRETVEAWLNKNSV